MADTYAMQVKELKKIIENLDDDMEVFMMCRGNPCGNCWEVGSAKLSTYGFMGTSITCLMVDKHDDEEEEG